MTYFSGTIYNRENLKEKDREVLDTWYDAFNNLIDNAIEDYGDNTPSAELNKIISEIIKDFAEDLRVNMGHYFMELMVGFIESYPEDVKERHKYTQYFPQNYKDVE